MLRGPGLSTHRPDSPTPPSAWRPPGPRRVKAACVRSPRRWRQCQPLRLRPRLPRLPSLSPASFARVPGRRAGTLEPLPRAWSGPWGDWRVGAPREARGPVCPWVAPAREGLRPPAWAARRRQRGQGWARAWHGLAGSLRASGPNLLLQTPPVSQVGAKSPEG